ncbi:MAG: recombination protein F [Methanomethylovorans sp. PtaU1.Bin073]|nr:MAG: recombination protein F [Methanomethylovorans sp. PtaU1.Bin073]
MKLTDVKIERYKSFETVQSFSVDPNVTILVGKNESGKTAALEAIAKTNYFSTDDSFKFDPIHDYPRKGHAKYKKSGKVDEAVTVTYEIDEEEVETIEEKVGSGVVAGRELSITTKYDNSRTISMPEIKTDACLSHFCEQHAVKLETLGLGNEPSKETIQERLKQLKDKSATADAETKDENISYIITTLEAVQSLFTKLEWNDWLGAHIWENYLEEWLPKFMYFDEYYELPSRIDINHLSTNEPRDEGEKTAKALLELAGVETKELLSTNNFENFVAELESTSSDITQYIFQYWKNNTGLRVQFQVEPHPQDKFLNIRVWNDKHHMSLPLSNRSKGFNWFFSFIVWFSRIQEDKNNDYILLLDEPGLNLHAAAQSDLLNFIEDLCAKYQIIYTTHSPFMVPSDKLDRVRTIYEGEKGSEVSEAIQQKDPDTLFPLQAALGYSIAQNLFINKKNLLVEGPSDLIYLTMMSSILESSDRKGLRDDVTIVPVGGLDKVTSFISLLRGQKLDLVCLLDSFTDQKGKKRLEDLVKLKIIKENNILFFDQFSGINGDIADLEDLFDKSEYLKFFNGAFTELDDIETLQDEMKPVIAQINTHLGEARYNHYRPANYANSQGYNAQDFSEDTLRRFVEMFTEVNKRFA